MGIDISELWDFNKPEESERRFIAALDAASGDDALILQTQIARTYGIRQDFSRAQRILRDIESKVQDAGPEARAHFFLELGRSHASATHPPDSQSSQEKEMARSAFASAFEIAGEAGLDFLAVDALHMMTFVDAGPEAQIEWNRKALQYMASASDAKAKGWEASLRNNLGYALYEAGQYEEALREFKLALAARERTGNPQATRMARWMIAWTLRAMGRIPDALEIQLQLEQEWQEAGEPSPYVFAELEYLYRELEDEKRAEHYAEKRAALQ